MTLHTLLAILIGYAFGMIQAAYFVSKIFGKMDIREHGTGNAGASNITTIMGVKFGFIVGFVDVLKGMLAVLTLKWFFPETPHLAVLAGMMTILGHIFPAFINFRGGKGVAALVGLFFGLDWKLGILFILLVAIPAFLTDYIVVGSLTAFIALPIAVYWLGYPLYLVILGAALTLLAFWLHRGNLQRIRDKEETTISSVLWKKKK